MKGIPHIAQGSSLAISGSSFLTPFGSTPEKVASGWHTLSAESSGSVAFSCVNCTICDLRFEFNENDLRQKFAYGHVSVTELLCERFCVS